MFSVYRSQTAVAHLKAAWEQADPSRQQAMLRALEALDRQLQTDPHDQGESRQGSTRILVLAPLAVLFEVDEPRRVVRVLSAWAFCTRSERSDRLPWQPPLAD